MNDSELVTEETLNLKLSASLKAKLREASWRKRHSMCSYVRIAIEEKIIRDQLDTKQ